MLGNGGASAGFDSLNPDEPMRQGAVSMGARRWKREMRNAITRAANIARTILIPQALSKLGSVSSTASGPSCLAAIVDKAAAWHESRRLRDGGRRWFPFYVIGVQGWRAMNRGVPEAVRSGTRRWGKL
jgi:hypothetical protein